MKQLNLGYKLNFAITFDRVENDYVLTIATQDDEDNHIIYHHNNNLGLKINGEFIEFDKIIKFNTKDEYFNEKEICKQIINFMMNKEIN